MHGDTRTTIDLATLDSSISMPRGIAAEPCGKIYIESEGKISVLKNAL